MDINIQKESPPEKKPSSDNKNKFHALLAGGKAKKRTLSEIPQDNSDTLENASTLFGTNVNSKATYLNSLLKKSFFNTINKSTNDNSLITQRSNEIIPDENSNSKLYYPEKVPKNFLPPYLFDSININKNKKITRQTKNELRNVLDLYDKQKNNMEKYENDLKEAKEDLKKAKEARKKIMEEVYEIKKEIELINNNENNIPLNKSRMSVQINGINDLFRNLTKGPNDNINEENEKKKKELDNEIKSWEDKISQLKFKNKSFIEDYDMLLNDYKKNLNKNLKLKNCIYDIDNKTKEALKEKGDLKKYINKMGKI